MGTKHKQDFLYQAETPIVYKLWKGMRLDSSTVKVELILVEPAGGNKEDSLNKSTSVTFSFSDSLSFLNLSSNQSGFIVSIKFKTQHKPAGAHAAGDLWVDHEQANITLANSWFSHLWDNAKLYIGGTEIETINHFGTVFETLSHLRGFEYRERSGINESRYLSRHRWG